jgi:hypothetical protein
MMESASRSIQGEADKMSGDFKWRHFVGEIILWAVRWYYKYGISYRELEEMMVWITLRCIAGYNTMLLKSRSVCVGPGGAQPGQVVGMSMRPTSKCVAGGFISTGL